MPFLRLFLLPIALFYGLAVFFRNMLFDYGIFSSKEYTVPIYPLEICVLVEW